MTEETGEKGTNPSGTGTAIPPEEASCCAPGCGCGEPGGSGSRKFKIAVCIAVVVAIAGILFYKHYNARQAAAPCVDNCCPAGAGTGASAGPCK
jgi:anthranilate phosphoribosyltransferase